MKKSLRFFHLAVLFGSSVIHANAASGTWTNTATGGNWSLAGNWTPAIADGSTFTANFSTLDLTADNTVHLDTARTLTNLTFGDTDTATAAGWILDNNATPANILTLSGTTPTITVNALGTGKTTTISGVIAGTVGMNKAGTGTLVLSGANTLSGAVNVNGGTLEIPTGGSLAAAAGQIAIGNGGAPGGTLVISGGTVSSSSANLLLGNNGAATLTQTSGSFSHTGTGGLFVGNNVGGGSTVNLSGGTFADAGTVFFGVRATSTFTMSAPAAVSLAALQFGHTAATTSGHVFNLNGGVLTLTTGGISTTSTSTGNTINLNGGTLKAGSASGFTWPSSAGLTAVVGASGVTFDSNSNAVTIAQALTGASSGVVTKSGAGTVTLSGANTISSGYTVSGGGLVLAGTNVNTTGVTLGANSFGLKVANAVPSGTAITATTGTVYLADGVTTNANATFSNGGSRNGFFLGNAANWGGTMTFSGTGGTNFATSTSATISGNVSTAGTVIFRNDSGGATSNPVYGYTAPSGTPSVTLSGITSGTGGIQAGVGTAAFNVTLTGVNTYTGTTGIQNGGSTLTIGGAGSLGSGSYAGAISFLTSGATLRYNSTAAQTFSGVLSGSGGNLIKENTSTLKLTGTNTFTGTTSINAGKLVLDYTATASSVLASTMALQTRGGELVFDNLGAKNQTFATTSIVSGATSKLTRGVGYTSGVVNLGTISRTTGSLDISSITGTPGWIKATGNSSAALLHYGSVTANNRANLVATDVDGFLITAASTTDHSRGGGVTTGAGVVRLIETGAGPDTAATPVTLTGLPGSTTDITSLINSYSPTTASPDTGLTLDIGATKILRLSATGFLSSVGGTSLTLTNGTLTSGGAPDTAGVLTFVSTNPIIVDSVIADNGTGVVDVVKIGADSLTFSGSSSNTYTGTTTVNAGPLILAKTGGAVAVPGNLILPNLNVAVVTMGADNQFGSTSILSFTGATENGRFHLMGTAQTLAGLSETNGKGVVQNAEAPYSANNTGTGTLTLNVTSPQTFNGFLRSGAGSNFGTLNLVKNGGGTQTLSGNNITYTGTTTVNAGTLKFASNNALNTSIANNATVEINALTATDWVMGVKTLSGPGIWNKTGVGTASFSSSIVTASGQINVTEGTLRNNNNASNWSGSTADIDVSSGAILDLFADAIYVDQLTGTGFVQNGYGNTSGQSGVLVNTEKLVVGVNNGTSTFPGVIRNNSTNTAPAAATAGGGVQLEKTGTGSFTLTNANTYTGVTSINGGQLILDYTTPASVLGATPLQTRGGELVFNNLGAKSHTSPSTTVVSGASKLTLGSGYGGGVVDLGTLSRTSGTLDISSVTGFPGWVKASGTLSNPLLFDCSFTTDGGTTPLATDASGFLITATTSDWSRGGTATPTGLLRLAANGSGPNTAGLPISLAALPGSTIDVTGIFNGYSAATAAPDTSVTLDIGAGKILRLAAAGFIQSFAGTDLVLANGTLTAGGADNTAGTITVNAVNNVSIGSSITDNGTGMVGLVKNGTGTLTLSGASTYTGSTTVNTGTLALTGGDNRLPIDNAVSLAGSVTLDVGDTNQTLKSLTGIVGSFTHAINGSGGSLNITATTPFNLANGSNGTNQTSTLNIAGATVGFPVSSTFYVANQTGSNNAQTVGTLNLNAGGALNVGTLIVAYMNYTGGAGSASAGGTINVNSGGSLSAKTVTMQSANHQNGLHAAAINVANGGSLLLGTVSPGNSVTTTYTNHITLNGGTIKNYDASTNLVINALIGTTHSLTLGTGTPTFEISSSRTGTVSEPMVGTGSLTKTGEGILSLPAASTYSGGTTVTTGVLLASNTTGSATGTGAVTVKTGTFLAGKGIVTGAVGIESGGTLSPGVSLDFPIPGQPIGTLSTGELTLPAGATLEMNVDSSLATTDTVAVTGNVTLGGTLAVTDMALPSVSLVSGSKLILMTYTGTLTGTFAGLAENATVTVGGNQFKIHYNDSNKVTLEALSSPYDTWAASKGLVSGNNGADQDADNDGLKNLIEFYLNGNPLDGKPVVAPVATVDEDYLILTFERATAALSQSGLTAAVQYGSDLNGWEEMAIAAASSGPDANGVIVTVVDHPSAPSTITVKIPKDYATDGKLFGRLKVQR